MKKLLLILIGLLLLSGCFEPKPAEVPEYVGQESDALIDLLQDANAEHLKGEIFYNIFPISFADGNGDGFGDLKGIIESLDYLKELGVKGIWLNPIHPSPSYHKYDVMDYYAIDPQFGTMDDFKALIKAIDDREMVLIMDMVLNHSSSQHPWFLSALKDETGYEDYYIMVDSKDSIPAQDKSAWYERSGKFYYGSFWSEMPEFNLESDAVRTEFRKILKYWLDLGVDGFRYDAAKHAYDQHEYAVGTPTLRRNLQFWLEMKAYVKEINPQAYVVAEVWMEKQAMAAYGWAFDAMFNFDFGDGVIEAIRNANSSSLLSPYLQGLKPFSEYPHYLDATFLKNHDQPRIGTLLNGDIRQLKLAASILLTMPGNPYIYYGEELGYFGNKPDERIREPLKWDDYLTIKTPTWETVVLNKDTPNIATQHEDPLSLLNHYKSWGQFRDRDQNMKLGEFKNLMTGNQRVMAYTRNDEFLIVHNLSGEVQEIEFEIGGDVVLSTAHELGKDAYTQEGKLFKIEPYTSLIIEIQP